MSTISPTATRHLMFLQLHLLLDGPPSENENSTVKLQKVQLQQRLPLRASARNWHQWCPPNKLTDTISAFTHVVTAVPSPLPLSINMYRPIFRSVQNGQTAVISLGQRYGEKTIARNGGCIRADACYHRLRKVHGNEVHREGGRMVIKERSHA